MPVIAADEQSGPHNPFITPYEQQRLNRIVSNRKRMEEMGIVQGWNDFAAKSGANRSSKSRKRPLPGPRETSIPSRQSARLMGVQAEAQQEPDDSAQQEKQRTRAAVRAAVRASRPEEKIALAELNLHRLQTMSDEAMSRRISKILRIDKLESLIEVLKAAKKDELIKEAQEALAVLR